MLYVVKQIHQEKKNTLLNVEEGFLNGEKGYPESRGPGCLFAPLASNVSQQICPLEESLKSTQLISCLSLLVATHHRLPQGQSQALGDLVRPHLWLHCLLTPSTSVFTLPSMTPYQVLVLLPGEEQGPCSQTQPVPTVA